MPYLRITAIFCTMAVLSSCASPQKYNARLNQELGKSQQQLISSFGTPSSVKKFANGDKIISYVNLNYQTIPDPDYDFSTDFMTENELFTPFTFGGDEIPIGNFMGETITDYCKTDFYLTGNIVTSWQWRGNACGVL